MRGELDHHGYAVVADVLDPAHCDDLLGALSVIGSWEPRRRGGLRNLFALVPAVRQLAHSGPLRDIVDQALSPSALAVRALLFDKTPESNWYVPWHQDATIAVSHRADELEEFGPWSSKAGITHVQPPVGILEHMVNLRLHLDSCGPDNGALEVIPGSHRRGLSPREPSPAEARICPVPRGGVLAIRPLLWHRSAKAVAPDHRRVVHIEYADIDLPEPLQWHERR